MANIFERLLQGEIDVHSKEFDKSEILLPAAKIGHIDAIRFLIGKKVDVDVKDSEGRSLIDLAIDNDRVDVLIVLLESCPQLFKQEQLEAVPMLLNNVHRSFFKNMRFSALEKAADGGYVQIFRLLLDSLIGLEPKRPLTRTFLHMACSCGDLETTNDLLEKDSSQVGATDAQRRTPLHAVVSQEVTEALEIISLLLGKGAEIDARDKDGNSPLMLAAKNGHMPVIKLLIQKGASLTAKNDSDSTALHEAANSRNLSEQASDGKVNLLQLFPGSNLESTDNEGRTPLLVAAQNCRYGMVRALIQSKANINAKDNGGTPVLQRVAMMNVPTMIHLCKGADVEVRDKYGWTPLELAAEKGRVRVARGLLYLDANVNAADEDGWTPLFYAARSGHEKMVQFLINYGASVELSSKSRQTALHLAVLKGREEVVKVLLREGAVVDAKGSYDKTPLHLAAENGKDRIAKILLCHGANIEAKTTLNWTALHFAAAGNHKSVVRLLIEKGANPQSRNAGGQTPQDVAAAKNHNFGPDLFEKPQEVVNDYHYTPLEGLRQIRILVIQPGEFEDSVHCSLEIVSLDTVVFEAMSYVWGDEPPEKQITISGGNFKVRDNVLSALLRIRKKEVPRAVWIDAICINQDDILERNQQITLMTEIYSRASEVVIWHGKDDKGAQNAFDDIGSYFVNRLDEGGDWKPDWTVDIVKFLSNPWFMRAWIFQEIVCSKAATVYCGLWEPIDTGEVYFAGAPQNTISWGDVSTYYEQVGEDRILEGVPTGFYSYIGPMALFQKQYNSKGETEKLLDLLALLEARRDSRATDPRDKVFSLLGLSKEGANGTLRADYHKSVEEVYIDTARQLLRSRTDLRLLNAVQERPPGSRSLPSWVPDWSEPWKVRSLVYDPLPSAQRRGLDRKIETEVRRFSATAGALREVELDDSNPLQIKIKGRSFAQIQIIADFTSDILNNDANHLCKIGFPLDANYPLTESSYLVALCQTVLADLFLDEVEQLPETATFEDLLRLTKKRAKLSGANSSRCLFLTDNGYVGIAPAHIQKGHEVCFLYGGDVPYIVQRLEDDFRLVGECYCFGVMYGEAMDFTNGKDQEMTYVFN